MLSYRRLPWGDLVLGLLCLDGANLARPRTLPNSLSRSATACLAYNLECEDKVSDVICPSAWYKLDC